MSRPCKACAGTGGGCLTGDMEACGACGGAGLIWDRTPAADALADAETLARYQTHPCQFPTQWDWRAEPRALPSDREKFVATARASAHYAFRAVPGLRA